MTSVRSLDLAVLALFMLYTTTSGLDITSLLKGRYRQAHAKRTMLDAPHMSNPCPEPEKPFPCKDSPTCIPMAYVCDDNYDCEDGYDEDSEVCTAAHRPPVEDIMQFLESEKHWMMPNLFAGKSIGKVAHGLAVSQTVSDFKRRLSLSSGEIHNLKTALKAVREGHEDQMEEVGMPSSAWNEVSFFFAKLLKSGFEGQ